MDIVNCRMSQDRPHLSLKQFIYRAGIGTDQFLLMKEMLVAVASKGLPLHHSG